MQFSDFGGTEVFDAESIADFWRVVKRCIIEFHSKKKSALRRMAKARKIVEANKYTMYYHGEPFHVACDLARHQLDVRKYIKRYLEIRDNDSSILF